MADPRSETSRQGEPLEILRRPRLSGLPISDPPALPGLPISDPPALPGLPISDPAGALLGQALGLMHAIDEGNKQEFQNVLAQLQGLGAVVAGTAGALIDAAGDDPGLRWSLLYLLSAVGHPASLDVLQRQALRQLPERVRQAGICEQPADGEELVAVMAIGGLGALAAAGNQEAVAALLEVVAAADRRSTREAAVAAVLAAQPDLRSRVEEVLPESERYVFNLRDATEEDLEVKITEEELARNPKRRPAGQRPPLP